MEFLCTLFGFVFAFVILVVVVMYTMGCALSVRVGMICMLVVGFFLTTFFTVPEFDETDAK